MSGCGGAAPAFAFRLLRRHVNEAERLVAAQPLPDPKCEQDTQRPLLVLVSVGKWRDAEVLIEEPVISAPDQLEQQPRSVLAPSLGNCLEGR